LCKIGNLRDIHLKLLEAIFGVTNNNPAKFHEVRMRRNYISNIVFPDFALKSTDQTSYVIFIISDFLMDVKI